MTVWRLGNEAVMGDLLSAGSADPTYAGSKSPFQPRGPLYSREIEADDSALTTGVFNLALLKAIATEPEEQMDVSREYEARRQKEENELRTAVGSLDMPNIARLAHRMKGAARMVGAAELAEACAILEENAGSGDPEVVNKAAALVVEAGAAVSAAARAMSGHLPE